MTGELIALDEPTVKFFVCTAEISFGIAGLAGAYEIFKDVHSREQEIRYLRSILLIALILVSASLIPLALAERERERTFLRYRI